MRQRNTNIFDRSWTCQCDVCDIVLPLVDDYPPKGTIESRYGATDWIITICPNCDAIHRFLTLEGGV